MRLQIKSTVWADLSSRLGNMVLKDKKRDVTASFKAVESSIHNANGGVGELQTAVDEIEERVNKVELKKQEKVEQTTSQLYNFITNFRHTDKKIAEKIKLDNQKFYEINPWAVPPPPPRKKKWYEKAWDAIKGAFKSVGKAIKKAVDWVVSTAKKAWKATVDFCKKHWKAIVKVLVGVVVIAGLAALSVFTGGAAAPLFAVAAKAAAVSALTSTAITVVSGVAQGKGFGEIFDSAADSFMIGSITGAVSGFAGAAGGAVASATGSQVLGKLTEVGVNTAGKMLAHGASYLIDNGNLKGFMDKKGYGILKEAGLSALSIGGDYLKGKGLELLKDKFGGLSNSQLVNSLTKAYEYCKDKAPALTNIVTKTGKDLVGSLSWSDLAKLKDPSSFAKELGNRALGSLVSNAKGEVGNFVQNDLNNLTGGAVGDAVNSVVNSDFGKAVAGGYQKVTGIIDEIKSTSSGFTESISNAIGHISGEFKDVTSSIGSISDIIGKINVGTGVSNIADKLGSSFGINTSKISGISGTLGKIIGSATTNPVQNISHIFGNSGSKAISSICGSSFSKTLGTAVDAVSKADNFTKSTNTNISSILSHIRL